MSAKIRSGALLALMLTGCFSDPVEEFIPGDGTGTDITGRLILANGEAASGAALILYAQAGSSAKSGSAGTNGAYSLSGMESGSYALLATVRRGDTTFAVLRPDIAYSASALELGTDTLRPTGGLKIQVTTADGTPIAGAACDLEGIPRDTLSDASGICAFDDLPSGRFGITITRSGIQPKTLDTLRVRAGQNPPAIVVPVVGNGGGDTTHPEPKPVPHDSGLLAGFSFPEGAGNTTTSAGSVNLAASVNGPTWAPGIQGSGMRFNGESNHVQAPNAQALTGLSALTVEAWVKPASAITVPFQRIAAVWGPGGSEDDSWSFSLVSGGKLTLEVARGGTYDKKSRSSTNIVVGQWNHVVGVWSPGTIRLYMNGVQVYSGSSITGSLASINRPLEIGAILQGSGSAIDGWPGDLDEVKIFGRAMAETEIQGRYAALNPAN